MRPTKDQVTQSLAALTHHGGPAGGVHRPARRIGTDRQIDAHRQVVAAIGALPAGLVEQIERTIDVRPDRLVEARARLELGLDLSPDELADRIVGRLVCDRLR